MVGRLSARFTGLHDGVVHIPLRIMHVRPEILHNHPVTVHIPLRTMHIRPETMHVHTLSRAIRIVLFRVGLLGRNRIM